MALRTKIICHEMKCPNNVSSLCTADTIRMEKMLGKDGIVICYDRYIGKDDGRKAWRGAIL